MEKKNPFLRILGLALFLAILFANCEIVDLRKDTNEEEEIDLSEYNAEITLDSSEKYQYVRGFGGMDVAWSNFFNISSDDYQKMYSRILPESLGLNILRIMIMPVNGEYTENPKTYTDANNNGKMDEDEKFDFTTSPVEMIDWFVGTAASNGPGKGLRPNYLEGVNIVNNNGGYVLASPWSPPPAWKTNTSILGNGSLNQANYLDYANYLKTYAQEMASRGAPIYAISIQNEPNFDTSKEGYAGCKWSAAEARFFFETVRDFTNGIPGYGGGAATTRVLIMNAESANTPEFHEPAMVNTTSRGIINLLGRHNYGDLQRTPYNPGSAHGKEMWMTEMNINSGSVANYRNDWTWNYVWQFLNDVDLSIRLRSDNAYVWWALKRFYSFIGEGGTVKDGNVTVNLPAAGTILPRGYAISHYAKFAKEKHRIGFTIRDDAAFSSKLKDGNKLTETGNRPNINHRQIVSSKENTSPYNLSIKITAFISDDGNEIGVVMYTPTMVDGTGGYDLGNVKINLPAGFVADPEKTTAMRSNANAKAKTESVGLSEDGKSAIVNLPASTILSVKFAK